MTTESVIYLGLVAVAAEQLRRVWAPLRSFAGLPGYLFALGAALFLTAWWNLAAYAVFGWGTAYLTASWGGLMAWTGWRAWPGRGADSPSPGAGEETWSWSRRWGLERAEWFGFLLLFVLVVSRFVMGLGRGNDGAVWCNFNFVDTAFHLSVTNAFLESPRFPPMDLDMAPLPLKYHFLADFFVAHLNRLGANSLSAMWVMNVVSAAVLVGSLWAAFRRWLRLPPHWVLLASLLFLFLNTSLINLAHFVLLNPSFFRVDAPVDGIMLFPFFNFESSLTNLFEPQRGLLFSFPIMLLILHVAFGARRAGETRACDRKIAVGGASDVSPADPADSTGARISAFWLVCLLPLGHIIGFAVMAVSLIPALWADRRAFFSRWSGWVPVFVLGLAQLWFLLYFGPPTNPNYSDWDVETQMPLNNFAVFPEWMRRPVFWFFVNGDFLVWGGAFIVMALIAGWRREVMCDGVRALRAFLRRWFWYLAACVGCFTLINFYRYCFFWGDSNKFVLFLNLGLAMVITLGAARWRDGDGRTLSQLIWLFFFALCVGPHAYEFNRDLFKTGGGKILIFNPGEQAAARWLREHRADGEVVLTSAYNIFHFVTPLAGAPTRAGIYGDSNPHRRQGVRAEVKSVYRDYDLAALRALDVRYLCISRAERRRYPLHENWNRLLAAGTAVVFNELPFDNHDSVFLIDCHLLPGFGETDAGQP